MPPAWPLASLAAGVERLFYSAKEKEIYDAWLKFRDGDPGRCRLDS